MLRKINETMYNLRNVMHFLDNKWEWKEVPADYVLCGICETCKLL